MKRNRRVRNDAPGGTADAAARSPGLRNWLTAVALAAATFAVFAPALNCKFVNYDDPEYVLENDHVRSGLSADNLHWAFTTFTQANWHPLTWLSLQVDAAIWGQKPFGFHLTNVALHAASAALLFLALRALTGSLWRSVAVALLFAVHPLRVESVAWVAERKDVLSVFFGLAALRAYAGYVRTPSAGLSVAVAVLFALSLASKPTLVTLPCLLLVLDWWPAGRARTARDWPGLVVEKIPLFALAIAASVVTYLAQAKGGAVQSAALALADRAGNAAISYAAYLAKTIWPTRLAVYYPHPALVEGGLDPVTVATAIVLLAALTAVALRFRKRAPYLLAGWLWYLGTLVPMIGLVQAGAQAYADRYSYFPQVGILIAICWGTADLAGSWPRATVAAGALAAVALAVLSWMQLSYWRDSVALWEHDLKLTTASPLTLYNCGEALQSQNRLDEAAGRFRKALELDPRLSDACFHLGMIDQMQGRLDEAAGQFARVCQLDPKSWRARGRLGDIYRRKNLYDDAARQYELALELKPLASTYCNLALVQQARGNESRAAECYRSALALDQRLAEAHNGLGMLLVDQGRIEDGIAEFREALRCDPGSGPAPVWFNLGQALGRQGRFGEAAECLANALALAPAAPRVLPALVGALDGLVTSGFAEQAGEIARRARDRAAAAGQDNLARRLDDLRNRYERGQTAAPTGSTP